MTVIYDKELERFPRVKLVRAKKVLCGPGISKLDVLGKLWMDYGNEKALLCSLSFYSDET